MPRQRYVRTGDNHVFRIEEDDPYPIPGNTLMVCPAYSYYIADEELDELFITVEEEARQRKIAVIQELLDKYTREREEYIERTNYDSMLHAGMTAGLAQELKELGHA